MPHPLSPLQDFSLYNAIPDYLQKSFAGQMMRYAPNGTAPIFGLTNLAGAGEALSVEHGYFSKSAVFPHVTTTAEALAADTTISVEDTGSILPAEILQVDSTKEHIRVTSVDSPTQITVVRAFGGVSAATIPSGSTLYSVGNSHEQASLRPMSRLINPVRVMNKTQIFRNTWALPGTMTAISPIVGGSLTAESRDDCGFFHASDIERALIFGQQHATMVNGQYLTKMDGIIESVRKYAPAENTSVAGATTTFDELELMLNPVFNTTLNGQNSDERVLFCGRAAQTVINNIGRKSGQYQLVDRQTNFGLKFKSFQTSQGMFHIIVHPMLSVNPTWSKMALALDMSQIKLLYLKGRKTQNREFGMDGTPVDNGVDAVGGTLTTECTLEVLNPSAMAVVYNLTAAA